MFIVIALVLLLIYLYLTKNHNYWKNRNVKHDQPIPFFGNFYQNVVGKRSITEISTEFYKKYPNEKIVGMYQGTTPVLLIRDLELTRQILNLDFEYFYPRGLGRDPEEEPIFLNLFSVDGDKWKLLRQRLTPAFTTAKLKRMFPLVIQCSEKLISFGEVVVKHGGHCDVRELMARYTTECIGACGFGLPVDSINSENSLRKFGKHIFDLSRSWKNLVLVTLYDLLVDCKKVLQKTLLERDTLNIATDIFESVCSQRNNKPSGRNDFIDLLLELSEKGTIIGKSIEKRNQDGSPVQAEMEMDSKCMVAQMVIFFAAGFETSSSATSYMLHELAYHPEEQIKIQKDIDRVLLKYDNKLCYESIAEMTLLSLGFKEAMRKFPSLGTLHRVCARQFTIPELNITIDPGVKIIIPVQAIQNDEKYFDNPSQFKPDRFADMSEGRHKYSYLPFGEGPRSCIGARLGEMQSLAGLAALLHKFTVKPGVSTKREVEVNHSSDIVQSIKGGLPLQLSLRLQS